jgi:HlyD family secretion protein
MKKTLYISGSVLIVVIVVVYLLFGRSRTPAYSYRFDKVTEGDLSVYVTATGTINAVTSVDVGTQVSGIVAKLYADFNSVVKKGQIIAQIDSTFLVQSVKDAQASLEKAKAQNAESKRNLDREKVLVDRGLDSQLNYDAALTTYESSQADLKSAEAALDRAKINLAYATIYAPISGVVINRAVNVGQTVAASFSSPTLFTIANDLKKMQVETTVDETDIGSVSVGQEATFTVDAYPNDNFTGTVSQIRLAPQSIQNVVNYIVIVDVNNNQLKLMPGMTANVKILVANASNVMKVSNMALRFQPPSEVIDTAGLGPMRGMFRRRGGEDFSGLPEASAGQSVGARNSQESIASGPQAGGQQVREFSSADRERFRHVRDSIETAHGGKLSQDELRSEMIKIFAGGMKQNRQAVQQNVKKEVVKRETGAYGITSIYPEYEKGSYLPSQQTSVGRVWILESSGLLKPVFVRTSLNDGRYTEISSPKLKPGEEIVVGATSNTDSGSGAAQSPFAGGRGGFR